MKLAMVKSSSGRPTGALVVVALLCAVGTAHCFYLPRAIDKRWDGGQDCAVYQNAALHSVMDRVCDMCHQMFSHENPDLRAVCRSDCFKNEQFRTCLALFSPAAELPIPPVRRRVSGFY